MNNLRTLYTTPLCIDHQTKSTAQSYASKRAIGSGYKDFLARGGIQLELASSEPGRASMILRHTKFNFTYRRESPAFHIIYGPDLTSFEVASLDDPEFANVETLPVDRRIEKFLNETAGANKEVIMEALGIDNERTFHNAMSKAKKRGHIETGRIPHGQSRWYSTKS